jgi:LemA protein
LAFPAGFVLAAGRANRRGRSRLSRESARADQAPGEGRFAGVVAALYMGGRIGRRLRNASMSATVSRLRALAALVIVGFGLSACGYNTIPTLEEDAKAKWAEVENQYQRRADLIPNLVATVQGYAKQEKDVLTAVTEARAKATAIHVDASELTDPDKVKQLEDAQNALSGALGRLLAVSENYPDLKSNQNFLALQAQLEGTENRIAVARRDYIASVQAYNTTLRTFPGVFWASTAFRANKPMVEFTATTGAETPPAVKFQ